MIRFLQSSTMRFRAGGQEWLRKLGPYGLLVVILGPFTLLEPDLPQPQTLLAVGALAVLYVAGAALTGGLLALSLPSFTGLAKTFALGAVTVFPWFCAIGFGVTTVLSLWKTFPWWGTLAVATWTSVVLGPAAALGMRKAYRWDLVLEKWWADRESVSVGSLTDAPQTDALTLRVLKISLDFFESFSLVQPACAQRAQLALERVVATRDTNRIASWATDIGVMVDQLNTDPHLGNELMQRLAKDPELQRIRAEQLVEVRRIIASAHEPRDEDQMFLERLHPLVFEELSIEEQAQLAVTRQLICSRSAV